MMTEDFRRARRCHSHLAGQSGVSLLDGLLARGWVVRRGREYTLTETGCRELGSRGFELGSATTGRGCLDLTERRDHLAGPLGRALLSALLANGRVGRRRSGRALTVRRRIL